MENKKIERCECCSRPGVLQEIPSLLDLSNFRACVTCFDHRAHPLQHVIRVERQVEWKNVPKVVKQSITIWCDERYVSVVDWARRAIDQQVIVYQGAEFPLRKKIGEKARLDAIEREEAEVKQILAKAKAAVDRCPRYFLQPKRPRGILSGIWGFLGGNSA